MTTPAPQPEQVDEPVKVKVEPPISDGILCTSSTHHFGCTEVSPMKKLLLTLILLLPATSFAHNLLWLDADNITSSTVLIRTIENHSEFASSGAYFDLGSGSNLDIDIDLQGESAGCCNYVTGGFNSNSYSSLKIKIDSGWSSNRVELDYDYTGLSTYHHM